MAKTRILFVGHDLKFLRIIYQHFTTHDNFSAKVVQYKGHSVVDHQLLVTELLQADIIFCEWGLGNLTWLSRNKFPDQKIVVRIHLQEFSTDFLDRTDWSGVSRIILVGPTVFHRFINKFPDLKEKAELIYNVIDTKRFNLEKEGNARFHLGILGVLPKRKAPHQALRILFELKKRDNRYRLFIKGNKPQDLPWLLKRDDEVTYYTEFVDEIHRLELQDSITWDDFSSDVEEWFKKIGYILSPSEFESFHMSVAEGMASGAIPVIANWEGAGLIYPAKYVYNTLAEAVEMIHNHCLASFDAVEIRHNIDYVDHHFGLTSVLSQYDSLFNLIAKDQIELVHSSSLREVIRNSLQKQTAHNSTLIELADHLQQNVDALVVEIAEKVTVLQSTESDLLICRNEVLSCRKIIQDNHNLLTLAVKRETNLNEIIEKLKGRVSGLETFVREQKTVIKEQRVYIDYMEKKFLNKVLHFLQKLYIAVK